MNSERQQDLHRLMPWLMWPGIVIALPALAWFFAIPDDATRSSFARAGMALICLAIYAVGWAWTLLLGVPAALWSLHVERNAFRPLPAHSVTRTLVAITLLSIVVLWELFADLVA